MTKKHDPASFQVSLKILLTNKRGEHLILLAVSQRGNPIWHGKYDLPGGRINNNEIHADFHQLIDREIIEEVGPHITYKLRPDPVALSMCQYPGEAKKMFILFEAKYISGTIRLSDEHFDYTWTKLTPHIITHKFPTVLRDLIKNYLKWNT